MRNPLNQDAEPFFSPNSSSINLVSWQSILGWFGWLPWASQPTKDIRMTYLYISYLSLVIIENRRADLYTIPRSPFPHWKQCTPKPVQQWWRFLFSLFSFLAQRKKKQKKKTVRRGINPTCILLFLTLPPHPLLYALRLCSHSPRKSGCVRTPYFSSLAGILIIIIIIIIITIIPWGS